MRLIMFGFFAALAAGQSAPEVVTLEPASTASLPVDEQAGLKDFVAGPQGLYFLAAGPEWAEILRTGETGVETGRMRVPDPEDGAGSRLLRFDGQGGAAVLESGSFTKLLFLDAAGLRKQLTIRRPVAGFAILRDQAVVLTGDTSELFWPDSDQAALLLSPAVTEPAMVLEVGPDALAILEGTGARLRVVTADRVLLSATDLSAPEIDGRVRRRQDGAVQNILFGATATADGRILTLVSDWRESEGAILLEFDLDAKLQGRFRLRLPPGMLPSQLAVRGSALYLVSYPDRMFATYPLPPAPAEDERR